MPDGSFLYEYYESDSSLENTEVALLLYKSFSRGLPKHIFNSIIPLVQLRNSSVVSSKKVNYPFYPQIFGSVVLLSEKLPKFEIVHLYDLTLCYLNMLYSNDIKLMFDALEALQIITATYHKYQPLYIYRHRYSTKEGNNMFVFNIANALNNSVILPNSTFAVLDAYRIITEEEGSTYLPILKGFPMNISSSTVSVNTDALKGAGTYKIIVSLSNYYNRSIQHTEYIIIPARK